MIEERSLTLPHRFRVDKYEAVACLILILDLHLAIANTVSPFH